ncbi:TetR/AcrR family transcriptional regulator [Azospirillum sp.]|uniref:TetR/AcrR family transcriptional regulator n=1 Tax=Azospirillum sp. TaxID=34012 RepID=UPI003D70D9EB
MSDDGRRTARERILDTAAELFYREGIRAVGIDTIIARSGVAKMSLYRNFASKDDLICAWLEDTDAMFWAWWQGVVARHPGDPRAQLKALFAALGKWSAHPKFRGCPFINTMVEFRDTEHPGRAIAERHARVLRDHLRDLAAQAGAREPEALAEHLLLMMQGAYAGGRMLGPDVAARAIPAAAAVLIDAACGQDAR